MRHEIHGGLSSHEIPFFVKIPDLFIHPRSVSWLSSTKREAMKSGDYPISETSSGGRLACFVLRAVADVPARVLGRTWERAVAVNWVGRDGTLVILASVVVAREGCRKCGVYAGSTTPDSMLV